MKLDPDLYPIYLVQNYTGNSLSTDCFNKDAKLFKQVINNIRADNNKRLILNQIIILQNIFTPHSVPKILFYLSDAEIHDQIISYCKFLNIYNKDLCPESQAEFSNESLDADLLLI